MSIPGLVMTIVSGILLFLGSVWLYSTTMTFGRSRASRAAIAMVSVGVVLGTVGVFLLLA